MLLRRSLILSLISLALLSSCQTAAPEIPENLSQAEFFQLAQEAAAEERWAIALYYYESYLERFPDDVNGIVAAEYEIAFLNYRMGNNDRAVELFQALIERYETSEESLVEWPRVLAERLILEITGEE